MVRTSLWSPIRIVDGSQGVRRNAEAALRARAAQWNAVLNQVTGVRDERRQETDALGSHRSPASLDRPNG